MPHWDADGNEEWVCQKGAHVCTGHSTWVEGLGNVCDDCLSRPKLVSRPMSLAEHCSRESGHPLGSFQLQKYISRHYGHD